MDWDLAYNPYMQPACVKQYGICRLGRLLTLLLVCALSGWAGADEGAKSPQTPGDIAAWIRDLSAGSFAKRESAAQALLSAGEAAKSALRKAASSKDREVRERAEQVLQLSNRRRRDELIASLRDGKQAKLVAEVPGWKEFSEQYGDRVPSRELFAEMLKAEWGLWSTLYGKDPVKPGAVLTARYRQLEESGRTYYHSTPRGTILSLFVLTARFPDEFADHNELSSFMNAPEMHRVLLAAPTTVKSRRHITRHILGDWLEAVSAGHLEEGFCLYRAVAYRLHEASRAIGKRILEDAKSAPTSKEIAMQAMVLRKDREQAKLIEPYLTDTTPLGSMRKKKRELRDVALACLMLLEGHDVAQIGVKVSRPGAYPVFEISSLGYASEEEREAALETFQRLRAEAKAAARREQAAPSQAPQDAPDP